MPFKPFKLKPFKLKPFALLALCGLAAAFAGPAAAAPQYTLQDVGTLTPGGYADAQGINQAGDVFGHADVSTQFSLPDHVFFWSPSGGLVDVGALPYNGTLGFDQDQAPVNAAAMNDAGQIIGTSEVEPSTPGAPFSGPVFHAFLWTPAPAGASGAIRDLGTLGTDPNADLGVTAVAINKAGQVIGSANALTLTPQGYRDIDPPHGFLWTPGGTDGVASNPQMKDLGAFQPSLLDDKGRVVGLLNGVVTLYDGTNFVSLGDPPGFNPNGLYSGYRFTFLRLDAQGDVYGNFATPTVASNPFVWVPGQPGGTTGAYLEGPHSNLSVPPPGALTDAQLPPDAQVFWTTFNVFSFDPSGGDIQAVDLGGLVFDTYSLTNPYFSAFETSPTGLNAAGDLVGVCELPTGSPVAFLEHAGLMYDPNLHLQGPGAGDYRMIYAVGINDAGQIATTGLPTAAVYQNSHAFVLTPAGQSAPAAPTVQLIQPQSPDAGDPDQTVDVVGTGFAVGAVVTYDGSPLAATVYAETQILAHVPSADLTAGTHTVTVTDPGGLAGSGAYVVLPVRPVPSLVSVSPGSVTAGSPDTAVTFTGTGLYPETQVGYGYSPTNDTPVPVLSASADHTQITVRIPAAALTQAATLTFYAQTPGQRGAGGNAPPPTLTVVNPVPTITGISPATLPADTVSSFTLTVTGTGFVPGTQISWNGEYFPTTYVSPTQVTASIYGYNLNYPAPDTIAPGPVAVSVTNAAPGGGTASTTQTILNGPYPAPTLTGVQPGVAAIGQGYVFLTGSHFLHHSVVHVGSKSYPFAAYGNYLSADRTQMTLVLPPSALTAPGVYKVFVVNPGPGGGTSSALRLAVQAASLRVSAASVSYAYTAISRQSIVQATLADGPGADALGVTVTGATLTGAGAVSTALPLSLGTIPAYGMAAVTLQFPTSAPSGTTLILSVTGRYAGGSFVSSRRLVAP